MNGLHAVGELWQKLRDFLPQLLNTRRVNLLVASLCNDVAYLPLVATIEFDQDMPIRQHAPGILWLVRVGGDTEPEDIHGRRGLYRFKASHFADTRKSAIRANRQDRSYLVPAISAP